MHQLGKKMALLAAMLFCLAPALLAPSPAAASTVPPVGSSGLTSQDIGRLLERAESCVQSFFHDAWQNRAADAPTDYGVLEPAILRFYSPHVDWQDVYWQHQTAWIAPTDLFPYQVSVQSSLTFVSDQPNQVVVQFKVPAADRADNQTSAWDEHLETVTLVKNANGWVIDDQTSSPLIDGFTEAEMLETITRLYGPYISAPLRFHYADNNDYVFSGTNLQGETVTFHADKHTGRITQWF